MNRKLVLSLVLALALFTATICAGTLGQANAISVTPGGSNGVLFKQTSGSVTIGGISEDGVEIKLDGSYTENKFQFVQNIYMNGFAFDAQTNLCFDSFTLTITDYVDNSNVVTLNVEKTEEGGSKVYYGYVKNGSVTGLKVEIPFTPVESDKTAETDMYGLNIAYKDNAFFVNDVELVLAEEEATSNTGITFEYNVATMVFANSLIAADDESEMVMVVKSISNEKGTQYLTPDAEAVDLVIWSKLAKPEVQVNEDETLYHGRENVYVYNGIKAKSGDYYSFPVYGVSIIGQTMDIELFEKTADGEMEKKLDSFENESADKKSRYKLAAVGNEYEIRLYSATEVHILMVTSIEDKVATEFNVEVLKAHIDSELGKAAVKASSNFTLPSLKDSDGVLEEKFFIFSEEDQGIDTVSNITVQVAYKKPGSTSDWSWSTNFTVSFTAEGTWAFAYRVKDGSGNFSEIYEFTRDVIDNVGPEIEATQQLSAYKGVRYTITLPAITDDISGVDQSKTVIRLYKGQRGSEDVEEIKLYNDNSFIPDVITGEDESYSYYVEYIAYDYRGNASAVAYSYITVTEKNEDTSTTSEVPDWLFIVLVVACVALIIAIIALIFVKPKEEIVGRPEPKAVTKRDDKDNEDK